VFWLAFKGFEISTSGFIKAAPDLSMAGIGLVLGGMVFAQVHFALKNRIKKLKQYRKQQSIKQRIITNEELGFSLYTNPKFREFLGTQIAKLTAIHELDEYDDISRYESKLTAQERLDEILDKINHAGSNALSEEEKQFLNEYSNSL
jgi:hypothetical protein